MRSERNGLRNFVIGAVSIATLMGLGNSAKYAFIDHPLEMKRRARDYNQTESVQGKPYEVYSKQLVREYDQVKGIDYRILNRELEKLNGKPSEEVRADENILIPVYRD